MVQTSPSQARKDTALGTLIKHLMTPVLFCAPFTLIQALQHPDFVQCYTGNSFIAMSLSNVVPSTNQARVSASLLTLLSKVTSADEAYPNSQVGPQLPLTL